MIASRAGEPPSPDLVDEALAKAADLGIPRLYTEALSVAQAVVFLTAGFSVVDELVVLYRGLGPLGRLPPPRNADIPVEVTNVYPHPYQELAAVDCRAFDDFWALDARGLNDAVRATESACVLAAHYHPARGDLAYTASSVGERARSDLPALRQVTPLAQAASSPQCPVRYTVGYAIVGFHRRIAYLQRLAVDPRYAGRGIGWNLAVAALRRARRRFASVVWVNTPARNEPALSLYESLGFKRHPSNLVVLVKELAATQERSASPSPATPTRSRGPQTVPPPMTASHWATTPLWRLSIALVAIALAGACTLTAANAVPLPPSAAAAHRVAEVAPGWPAPTRLQMTRIASPSDALGHAVETPSAEVRRSTQGSSAPLVSPSPPVTLEITDQAFSLTPGSELFVDALLRIADRSALSDTATLELYVSTPIQSTGALRAVLEGKDTPSPRRVARFQVALPPTRTQQAEETIVPVSVRAKANVASPGALSITFPSTGVYSLTIAAYASPKAESPLARAETFIEFSYGRPTVKVYAALVAPLAAPPLVGPLANYPAVGDAAQPHDSPLGHDARSPEANLSRLALLAKTYRSLSDLPLSLALQPSTLSDLVTIASGSEPRDLGSRTARAALDDVVAAAQSSNNLLLATPYCFLPASFYSTQAFQGQLDVQWQLGRGVLEDLTAREATTEVALPPPDGFDVASLRRVSDAGFEAALARSNDFSEKSSPPKSQPILAHIGEGSVLPVFPAFEEISPALAALDRKSLRLSPAAVAAALVTTALESAAPRGVVMIPPFAWNPNPKGLEALMSMLRQSSFVEVVPVSRLFEKVPLAVGTRRGRSIAQLRPSEPQASQSLALTVANAISASEGLQSMVNPTSPMAIEATRALKGAPSLAIDSDVELDPRKTIEAAEAGFAGVSGFVRDVVSKVSIPPATGITLTAQSSLIPLRIENALAQPVAVAITLSSDKLAFPEGERMSPVTVPPGGFTVNVPVEAQATGTFALHVSLSSPDGKIVLVTQRLQVRFMRVGPVAILLGVGALGVLAYWWASQTIERRRRRRASAVGTGEELSDNPY